LHAGLENQKSHVGGYSCPPGKSAGGTTRVLAVSCLWCGESALVRDRALVREREW
jgi:hypothetical protein